MSDDILQILAFIDEALFGEWRVLLYNVPYSTSTRVFGLAVACTPAFFQGLKVEERLLALGAKVKCVGLSVPPAEGWTLYKVRLRNRKQQGKFEEYIEGRKAHHIERGKGYWEWLKGLPPEARDLIEKREGLDKREPIEWEEVKR